MVELKTTITISIPVSQREWLIENRLKPSHVLKEAIDRLIQDEKRGKDRHNSGTDPK